MQKMAPPPRAIRIGRSFPRGATFNIVGSNHSANLENMCPTILKMAPPPRAGRFRARFPVSAPLEDVYDRKIHSCRGREIAKSSKTALPVDANGAPTSAVRPQAPSPDHLRSSA